jgi:hypothetical protein
MAGDEPCGRAELALEQGHETLSDARMAASPGRQLRND